MWSTLSRGRVAPCTASAVKRAPTVLRFIRKPKGPFKGRPTPSSQRATRSCRSAQSPCLSLTHMLTHPLSSLTFMALKTDHSRPFPAETSPPRPKPSCPGLRALSPHSLRGPRGPAHFSQTLHTPRGRQGELLSDNSFFSLSRDGTRPLSTLLPSPQLLQPHHYFGSLFSEGERKEEEGK